MFLAYGFHLINLDNISYNEIETWSKDFPFKI